MRKGQPLTAGPRQCPGGRLPQEIQRIRTGYCADAHTAMYEKLDDGRFALIFNDASLTFKGPATRLLVALHEIVHHLDIGRHAEEYCRRLASAHPKTYERDIEDRAFSILKRHYDRLNQKLPHEALEEHGRVLKIVNG